MFIAFQTMARPSYMSGPRYYQQIYGRGDTAEAALKNATTFQNNGQTWSYGSGSGHPNACDLTVEEVDDDEDDDEAYWEEVEKEKAERTRQRTTKQEEVDDE